MKLISSGFFVCLFLRWHCVAGAWGENVRAQSILNWCPTLSCKACDGLGDAQVWPLKIKAVASTPAVTHWNWAIIDFTVCHSHRLPIRSRWLTSFRVLSSIDKPSHSTPGSCMFDDSRTSQVNHLTASPSTGNVNYIYGLYYVIQFCYTHLLPEILFSWISKWLHKNKAVTQLCLMVCYRKRVETLGA